MSYFNHSFHKTFMGKTGTQVANGSQKGHTDGFLTSTGVHTKDLSVTAAPFNLGKGIFGFFSADNFLSVNNVSAEVTSGKPLYLVGSSLYTNDKIGQFHGGYTESNKSKMINPRFISNFYKATRAASEQSIVHIGTSNYNANTTTLTSLTVGTETYDDGTYYAVPLTGGTGTGALATVVVSGGAITSVTVVNGGTGYTVGDVLTIASGITVDTAGTDTTVEIDDIVNANAATCNFEFLCGETYNLHVNLSGSAVLRTLNHDAYATLAAYTGCCPEGSIAPVAVDSTLVMINWAKQIMENNYLKHFVSPIVYTETGASLTTLAAMDAYVSTGHIPGATAGIRLIGAYVDTKFGNCSFETSDFFEKDIIKIEVSLQDLTGDACTFEGLCVNIESNGFTGQGFGETVIRDVIQHERYLQNDFVDCDYRMREIMQQDQVFNVVDRNALYTRYSIVHSIPRPNNPSSTFDSDQYTLTVYVPSDATAPFETFMGAWLTAANSGVTLQTIAHTPYVPVAI